MTLPEDPLGDPSALRVILEELISAARTGDHISDERVRALGLAAAAAQGELNALQRAGFRLSGFVLDNLRPLLEALETLPAHPAHKHRVKALRQMEEYLGLRMALGVRRAARGARAQDAGAGGAGAETGTRAP
jgi:hypothetical protein